MIIFFDTETTGLPKNWEAPLSDLNNWPRLVQIAWIVCDYDGNHLSERNYVVKPDGFLIPAEATDIHRISTERAIAEGVSLISILREFYDLVNTADLLVAHNMSFDEKIIGAELLRQNFVNIIETKKRICTMESATDYCKIPGKYGYKWPTLPELYFKLFAAGFDEAHDAAIDIKATAKCFWALKEKRVIQLPNVKQNYDDNLVKVSSDVEEFHEMANKTNGNESLLLKNDRQENFKYLDLQLREFSAKIPNIGHVINHVNNCKPILSRIKSQFDESDTSYVKVSSNIARGSWENLVMFLAEEKKIFNFLMSPSDSAAFDTYTILSKRRQQNSPYNRDNFIEILTIATSLSLKGPTIWGSGILSPVLCDGGGTNIIVAKSNLLSIIQESKNLMQSIGEFDMDSETRKSYSEMTVLIENLYVTIGSLSLAEPPKKTEPKSGCYIATMAYGSYDHPQVLVLRKFRDSTLTKHLLGRLFIKIYYRISPTIVRLLQNNELVNKWSRKFFDALIKNILKR